MYSFQHITNQNLWDGFVVSQRKHTFLQSWDWGDFNQEMAPRQARDKGETVWRIGAYDGDELVAAALVIKVNAKRGNFLFIPHGPILASGEKIFNFQFSIFKQFIKKFKEIAEQEKINFIRVSPLLEDNKENRRLFKKLGFRAAPIHMHAETTWTLKLAPTEEDLLMRMRKTTRNLIRRSVKEGVIIKSGTSERNVEVFNKLYQETVSKHSFVPFSLDYLKKQVDVFSRDDAVEVFTAYYNDEPIASAVVVFYGNSAFYHHGASSKKYPKIPAAYLLQWEAIREAKRRGHKFYNFWGIIKLNDKAQMTNDKHPWAGITLFKKGFGGFQTDYLHAQDLPLSWKYWPNYIFETARRIHRGL